MESTLIFCLSSKTSVSIFFIKLCVNLKSPLNPSFSRKYFIPTLFAKLEKANTPLYKGGGVQIMEALKNCGVFIMYVAITLTIQKRFSKTAKYFNNKLVFFINKQY